jgi:hypothetical protein
MPSTSEAERDARRRTVADLLLDGRSQAEIARTLDWSTATISRDVDAVREEWRERRVADLGAHVEAQLARLRRIEREAWGAWADSRAPKRRERTKTTEEGVERVAWIEEQNGDPRFLRIALKAAEERRELMRLHEVGHEGADDKMPKLFEYVKRMREERRN